MLRTNLKNYGANLPDKMDNWLKLIESDEYEAMKTIASGEEGTSNNKEDSQSEMSEFEGADRNAEVIPKMHCEESVRPRCERVPKTYCEQRAVQLSLPQSLFTTKAN